MSVPEFPEGTVLVLGAGFTRAFVPLSPLLVDFYEAEDLLKKFSQFGHARAVLQHEIDRNSGGRIDLERLMTRLDGLMPYDTELGAELELALLLKELKTKFRKMLTSAQQGARPNGELLQRVAATCVNRKVDCITFNYDDIFDECLWRVRSAQSDPGGDYWHPDGGYGFFCRPSVSMTHDVGFYMDRVSMTLLKLHGSINWRTRRGRKSSVGVDDILHHEEWYPASEMIDADYLTISDHLEDEPFIVPPVLTKAPLTREPTLRLIWRLAHDVLMEAKHIVFIGYSMPITDIASQFLFSEALNHPVQTVRVVNYADNDAAKQSVLDSYRSVLPNLKDSQFTFVGAVEWAKEFVDE